MLFWERVKSLISAADTTQERLSRQIPVRSDTFSRWIQRGTMPNADQAVTIARALNTSVEYLVLGADIDSSFSRLQLNQFLNTLPEKEIEKVLKFLVIVYPQKWEDFRSKTA